MGPDKRRQLYYKWAFTAGSPGTWVEVITRGSIPKQAVRFTMEHKLGSDLYRLRRVSGYYDTTEEILLEGALEEVAKAYAYADIPQEANNG